MAKVAVVILNWNGVKFLEKFLPKIIEYSKENAEVIVADNASTDHSIEFLQENFPEIRIIKHDINKGFAKGYNDTLKQVEAEYYVILNSDIEVSKNWIAPIIEKMDSHPEIGACQPKILSEHDHQYFEYAGAAGGFIDKYGYPFCRGRIFQTLEKDHGQYDQETEIFWATGACLFVRSELFHQLGGFDEDFFAHMEEIDFCWRMKKLGHKIMYLPYAKVYHVGGGTLPKSSAFKTYLNIRNNIAMLYKNLPSNQLLKILFIRLILDGIASVKFLFTGGAKEFWAVARAHMYIYRNMSKLKAKRKQISKTKTDKIYQGNIVFDHYAKGKNKFSELNTELFN
ncbi:MAG: glycosyltransferase family 2 protein [Bacteroidales bacterium]|nr:glycosyltransferase family 2 protein [Bacteroidales bacterium]